jgi:imidazolonepropionase-like amidohydrolase
LEGGAGMKLNIKTLVPKTAILAIAITSLVSGHDYVPGAKQTQAVLLAGGDLHTVSNGVLQKTDILFENGRITAIGQQLDPPAGARIIDVSGQQVYPGLIDPNTTLGLIEIEAARATNDQSERGRENPDVQTHIAYNPDSEIIPTVRSNGITTALIVPSGSLLRGRSSLINLDGWTKEDAMARENAALHLNWPRVSIITAWWMEQSAEDQKKENEENRKKLEEVFEQAKSYYIAKKADPNLPVDSRWDAMTAVFDRSLPVFIHAGDMRQIEQAVDFGKKYNLKIVIVGGDETYKAVDLLRKNNIPVVVERTQQMPMRADDPYDLAYTLPKLLLDAGVKFCLSQSASWGTRNLPFQAGQAVAYGLDKETALRSITLSTAEIIGVEKELGSLDVGKRATLAVSNGDILDQLTNQVTFMFIDGRQVDLDSKHKELYRKYKEKITRTTNSAGQSAPSHSAR